MPRKPTGQPPLKALAVKLPAPLIAEIRRYADHHRTTISKVLLEGVELRLHGVQSPSQAPGNSPIPAPTLATVTQIAATLTTAADQLRRLCQSPTVPETGQQLSTPTLSVPTGNPAYNGNTPLGEDTYNGNTSQTPAREPTTESAAKESDTTDTDTPAQTPDAPEPRRATKRGKQRASETNIPAFDTSKFSLGELCVHGHDFHGTGQSLRRLADNECLDCKSARTRAYRQRQHQGQPAASPAAPVPARRTTRKAQRV